MSEVLYIPNGGRFGINLDKNVIDRGSGMPSIPDEAEAIYDAAKKFYKDNSEKLKKIDDFFQDFLAHKDCSQD